MNYRVALRLVVLGIVAVALLRWVNRFDIPGFDELERGARQWPFATAALIVLIGFCGIRRALTRRNERND